MDKQASEVTFRDRELLKLLSDVIFAGRRLDDVPPVRERRIVESRLGPLFYFYRAKAYAQDYHFSAGRSLGQSAGFKQAEALFEANRISFLQLKGNLLIDRVYPSPAIRPVCDLDVLIRAEDAQRAWNLFLADGWKSRHPFINAPGKHLPTLTKGLSAVELHTFIFEGKPPENQKLWAQLDAEPCALELTFLHLIYHSFVHHRFSNRWQMLADLAFLLKSEGFSFERLQRLEQELTCSHNWSGLVLHAFPEFFPQQYRDKAKSPGEALCGQLRYLFFNPPIDERPANSAWRYRQLSRRAKRQFILQQLRKRTPSFIGSVYRLPARTLWLTYPFYLAYDLAKWSAFFLLARLKRLDKRLQQQGKASRDLREFLK